MTDIVEEAHEYLASVRRAQAGREVAPREAWIVHGLLAECERLRAENARLREAMPTVGDSARDAVFVASEIKRGTASSEDISRAADLLLRLAQATSCLPSAEVRVAIRSLVRGTMERPNRVWPETENIVNEWLARLDAAKEVR